MTSIRSALLHSALASALLLGNPALAQQAAPTPLERREEVRVLREKSDPASQLRLGDLLRDGVPVSASNPLKRPDHTGAHLAYSQVLLGGDRPRAAEAATRIAKLFLDGRGGMADATQAERLLRRALEDGSGEAAHLLASGYESGAFAPADPAMIESFYRTAFRLGDASAGQRLATLLGPTTPAGREMVEVTLKRLERQAVDDNAAAALLLGDMYRTGALVPKDSNRATSWYRRAAELGSDAALLRLGRLFASVDEGMVDLGQARLWIDRAAHAGSIDAAVMIAQDGLMKGSLGFDEATALTWLSRASEAEDARAQLLDHMRGAGVKPHEGIEPEAASQYSAFLRESAIAGDDLVAIARALLRHARTRPSIEVAHILLERAAEIGSIEGDYWIGRSTLTHAALFDARTKERGIAALERATRLKHIPAALLLADAFRLGTGGVTPSIERAKELYRFVIDNDPGGKSTDATLKLASMLRETGDDRDAAAAVQWLQSAADRGSPQALLTLARLFAKGRDVRQDTTAALLLMRQAAELGSTEALVELGDHLLSLGTREATKEAEQRYQAAWARQDVRGLTRLAAVYERRGDVKQGRSLLETAAQQGNLDAALRLLGSDARLGDIASARRWLAHATELAGSDRMRRNRIATAVLEQDDADFRANAREILDQNIAGGDVEATLILGRALLGGRITPLASDDGLVLIERAAQSGATAARLALAGALRSDRGKGADFPRALAIYAEILDADPTNAPAALGLARAHERGEGTPRDPARATAYYLRAAKLGDVAAMILVGSAYAQGIGIPRETTQARLWLSRAADTNDLDAIEALAAFLASGAGGQGGQELALKEYFRAAQLGSATAMTAVGRFLIAGIGSDPDSAAGLVWLERAAKAGDAEAMIELARLFQAGGPIRPDPAKSLELLKRAAEAGHAGAMFRLGVTLAQNGTPNRDLHAARTWLEKAVAGGRDSALSDLQVVKRELGAN